MQTLQQRANAASRSLAEITGDNLDLSHLANMAETSKVAKNIIEEVELFTRLTKTLCGLAGIIPMLNDLTDLKNNAKILEVAVGRASFSECLMYGETLRDLALSMKRLGTLLKLIQAAMSAGQPQ